MSNILLAKLTNDAEWQALNDTLDPNRKNIAVKNILAQLRSNAAASVLIEDEYLDRDFTAVYSAFYATVFKRHSKLCRRFHFFKEDITTIIDNARALESATALESAGTRSYLGFIVARPLSHAPLGRVVLDVPASEAGKRNDLLVYSNYEAHVLGACLTVRGIAMTQQETRVGACAQAAIWGAGRHFHMRHRGPWFTTVDITDAATQLTDVNISRSLPAGSEFLTPDNMLRALRVMGREALLYAADVAERPTTPGAAWKIQCNQLRPQDLINRYVDSGIPVLLGLCPLPNTSVGHAVLVTGRTLTSRPAGLLLPTTPTQAVFCEQFLVHDDQRGSNVALAIEAGRGTPEFPYTVSEHLFYLIVPLPEKVFIPAEYAERFSWDTLQKYMQEWTAHKQHHGASLGNSIQIGDQLVADIQRERVIARTYLTYGWRYKARMLQNRVAKDFKSVLFYHDLPRFVWVTEFGTFDSFNHLDIQQHRVYAHSVIDATASRFWEPRSIFHAPGMSVRWYHDESNPAGPLKDATAPITDDQPYFPKVRGVNDYSAFP